MGLEKEELLNKYNALSDKKVDIFDIESIYSKFLLITSIISFDEKETIDLVNILLEFKNNNVLEKINEESMILLSRAMGNIEGFSLEDSKYFCIRLKHLLMPSSLNRPSSEDLDDTVCYLAEFDIMINNILTEFQKRDYLLLKKYNNELFNIVIEYKKIINEYQSIEVTDTRYVIDDMIIDITFTHLATMLYFMIDECHHDYSLFGKVAHRIIENFQEFLFQCRIYHIFEDTTQMVFNPTNVYNEFAICKDMLEKEFKKDRIIKKVRKY